MSPLDLLVHEHRYIEIVLDCLSRMVEESLTRKKLNFLRAEETVDFFRNYADRWHHKKEEDILFKLMVEKDKIGETDYVSDLTSEHEKGRSHVRGMNDAFREAAHGDMEDVMNFGRHAREYIDLLRGHILKEDRIVFPFVEKAFGADDLSSLEEMFRKAESKGQESGSQEKFSDTAIRLAQVYNIETGSLNRKMID